MESTKPLKAHSTRAYGIFVEELRKQVAFSDEALRTRSPDTYRQLREIFHRIKGGAGFFGLHDIAEVSRGLEDFFSQTEAEIERIPSQAPVKLEELKKALRAIEEPEERNA